jgi:hypothetical protein
VQLLFNIFPLIRICWRILFLNDRLPNLGQLGVQGNEMALVLRQVIFGIYSLHRTFRHAQGTVYALVGINHKEIRPSTETVYRTNIHTVGILTFDARLGNNIGHVGTPIIQQCIILTDPQENISLVNYLSGKIISLHIKAVFG